MKESLLPSICLFTSRADAITGSYLWSAITFESVYRMQMRNNSRLVLLEDNTFCLTVGSGGRTVVDVKENETPSGAKTRAAIS